MSTYRATGPQARWCSVPSNAQSATVCTRRRQNGSGIHAAHLPQDDRVSQRARPSSRKSKRQILRKSECDEAGQAEPAHHHAPATPEIAEQPRGEARASVPPRVAGRVRALSERQHQAGPSVGGKSPNAGGTSLGAPPHRGAAAAPHRERAAGRGSGSAAPISTPA